MDRQAELERLVLPMARACAAREGAGASALAIQIETTGAEIVDIAVKTATLSATRCIEDSVWALALGPHFNRDAHFAFALAAEERIVAE